MNTQKAYQLGQEARQAGKPCAPCLNSEIMKLISDRSVDSVAAMKEYVAGWINQSLTEK